VVVFAVAGVLTGVDLLHALHDLAEGWNRTVYGKQTKSA